MSEIYAGRKFEFASFNACDLKNEAGIYIVSCMERPNIIVYLGQSDKVRDHAESRNKECWKSYCSEDRPYIALFAYSVHYTPYADENERLAIMKEVKKDIGNVFCKDEDSTS